MSISINKPLKQAYDSVINNFKGIEKDLNSNFKKTIYKISAIVLATFALGIVGVYSTIACLGLTAGSIVGGSLLTYFAFRSRAMISDIYSLSDSNQNKLVKDLWHKYFSLNSKFVKAIDLICIRNTTLPPSVSLRIDSFEKVQSRYYEQTNWLQRTFA